MITATTAAVLAAGLAGCSDDAPDEPAAITAEPTPTGTSSPSPTGPAEAEDVAALKELYADYWGALITSENGPNPDRALFDGIVESSSLLEAQINRVQGMIEDEQRRYGKPDIGDVTVTLDGDRARAEACIDQRNWGIVVQGQTQPPNNDLKPVPIGVRAERADDGWIIVDRIPLDEASLEC